MNLLLVDTSVWIDHLRRSDATLAAALQSSRVLMHPWIVGEIAMGTLKNRAGILGALQTLPQAVLAEAAEVLALIEASALHGKGLGFVDAALLASARLTPHARLWTRDRRLLTAAQQLGVALQGEAS